MSLQHGVTHVHRSPADGTAHLSEDVAADDRVRRVHHRLGHAEQHSEAVERRHVIVAEGLVLKALLQLGAVDIWERGGGGGGMGSGRETVGEQ